MTIVQLTLPASVLLIIDPVGVLAIKPSGCASFPPLSFASDRIMATPGVSAGVTGPEDWPFVDVKCPKLTVTDGHLPSFAVTLVGCVHQ